MSELADALAVLSGAVVGFVLGLIGGGGSILAVPLLLYGVGMESTHLAIGTSAVAVSANALMGLVGHAHSGTVKWPCAATFAGAGILGAWLGSSLGKAVDGKALLSLFAVAMIAVGVNTLLARKADGDADVAINPRIAAKLLGLGGATGIAAGFFGIGGGFLIVPGLMMGSGMAMLNAVGSSLVSVFALGAATAANYAVSGLVDWHIATLFVAGGFFGSLAGIRAAKSLAERRGLLTQVFGWIVVVAGLYVLAHSLLSG
ncbi:MAG: sulfite exporter TauE/SafE family protein [Alphaproteobacteria bacterium]|nr:sulfite exporter TauE/SafE family protein [Alphaproteobacteria bacterium]